MNIYSTFVGRLMSWNEFRLTFATVFYFRWKLFSSLVERNMKHPPNRSNPACDRWWDEFKRSCLTFISLKQCVMMSLKYWQQKTLPVNRFECHRNTFQMDFQDLVAVPWFLSMKVVQVTERLKPAIVVRRIGCVIRIGNTQLVKENRRNWVRFGASI